MARIVLSGDELVNILQANGLIPDHVTDVSADGREIRLRVKTPWPVLKSVRVGVRFAGFDDGQVVLQLVTNRVMDRFDWLIDRMLESMRVQDHWGRWEYPRLFVDVNRVIRERIRGVEIEGMTFEDGYFHVSTMHSRNGDSGPEWTSDENDSNEREGPV
jgi:hypothetical protein